MLCHVQPKIISGKYTNKHNNHNLLCPGNVVLSKTTYNNVYHNMTKKLKALLIVEWY